DGGQQRVELGAVAHAVLGHRPQPGQGGIAQQRAHAPYARAELAWIGGQVEHHELHPAPRRIGRVAGAHGAAGLLEAAAAQPQLAVHRHRRPAGGEPRRRLDAQAAARPERLAVPAAAHAVELLADPVARNVDAGVVARCKHESRRRGRACRQWRQRQRGQQAQRQQETGESWWAVHAPLHGWLAGGGRAPAQRPGDMLAAPAARVSRRPPRERIREMPPSPSGKTARTGRPTHPPTTATRAARAPGGFTGGSIFAAKTARSPTGVANMKHASLLGIALALATGYALAQDAMTEAQVRAELEAQGYDKVNDLKFEDGVWKADARSADGNRVDVRIDPATGDIRPDELVAGLSEADVRAQLAVAGYTNVHDVDYEDGIW